MGYHTHAHSVAGGSVIGKTFADHQLPGTGATSSDLTYLQWHLEWKITNRGHTNSMVSLVLKCIPKPEFMDKQGDVWINVGLTVYSGEPSDGEVIASVPSNSVKPIKLTRQNEYRYSLIHDPNTRSFFTEQTNNYKQSPYPNNLSLSKFGTHIGAEVAIIHLGCSFCEVKVPPKQDLRKDLGALLSFDGAESRDKFSDVTLVILPKKDIGNPSPIEFPAHKVILAARSPVFARMFEHDMQESSNNKVEVDDIDPEVLKEMLTYIYTDRVPNMKSVACGLLYVADKYQLDQLKALCEQHLSYSLQVDNAARLIQLAYMHNAPQLKRATLQFIASHGEEVRATKEWEEVKQCAEILDELIQVMLEPAAKRSKTEL